VTSNYGFGNKSVSATFALPYVIYRDILIHCVHVSYQEYQKKLKMYQKKVVKQKFQDQICHPEV
jgi:hypothetical protein